MSRTAVPYSNANVNGALADPAGTAADPTNGHVVSDGLTPPTSYPEQTVLRVKNTTGGALNAIVRAGAQPLAIAAGQGDLTVAVAAGAIVFIGPLESGRFAQKDGQIYLDLQAGFAGTVTALKVARR